MQSQKHARLFFDALPTACVLYIYNTILNIVHVCNYMYFRIFSPGKSRFSNSCQKTTRVKVHVLSLNIMMSRYIVPSEKKNWIVIIPPTGPRLGFSNTPSISSYPRDPMHPSRRVYVFACQVLNYRSGSATNQSKFQYARLGRYHNPNTDDITAS